MSEAMTATEATKLNIQQGIRSAFRNRSYDIQMGLPTLRRRDKFSPSGVICDILFKETGLARWDGASVEMLEEGKWSRVDADKLVPLISEWTGIPVADLGEFVRMEKNHTVREMGWWLNRKMKGE